MIIEVRGKTFGIDLVNNYVTEKYSEMSSLAFDAIKLKHKMEDEKDTLTKADIDEIGIQADKIQKDVFFLRWDILQELLESNDITYDENWWKKRTSVEDVNDFILDCIKKDRTDKEGKSKKK